MGRRTLRIATLVGFEVVGVVALHRLAHIDGLAGPGGDPAEWLRTSSPEEVVAGAVRLVAVGCAWWLLVSTVLYAAALAAGRATLARALCRLVLPAVRGPVERALAVSMMATATFGTGLSGIAAAGEPPPPATLEVRDGRAVDALPTPAPPPTTTGPPASVSPPTTPLPAPGPPPAPAEAAPVVHVVAAGESLWTIAAAHVEPGADVAQHWARVVEANRATLRSGNPNLIHPGEAITLPPA
jgi:nucleoid-associated protein YgaU